MLRHTRNFQFDFSWLQVSKRKSQTITRSQWNRFRNNCGFSVLIHHFQYCTPPSDESSNDYLFQFLLLDFFLNPWGKMDLEQQQMLIGFFKEECNEMRKEQVSFINIFDLKVQHSGELKC